MRWWATRIAVCLAAGLLVSGRGLADPAQTTTFAGRIEALSEPGGYFDTDNLISNERSYLSVLPALDHAHVAGGAYIGVGPDQNFSYIAAIRPTMAFIIDIRRDNLLLHLLFKALFAEAQTRVEYAALLCGRPVPADLASWRTRSVDEIVEYVEQTPASMSLRGPLRRRLEATIRGFGVPLSDRDWDAIARFHDRFIDAGPSLRFQTFGRAPQWHYPTLGDLLRATDGAGHQRNYLASEEAFAYVKAMEDEDRIVPVVGDLAGSTALRAIGRLVASRGERVSALYASNVEFYLWRDGTYGRFLTNLASLPAAENAVVIRSVFGGGGSESEIEPVARMVERTPAALAR